MQSQQNLDGSLLEFEQDSRICFFEKNHTYLLDGVRPLTPVSSVVSGFFKPFDSSYWSKRKAVERNVAPEQVLEEWDEKKERASQVGTFMHAQIEKFFRGDPLNLDYDYAYDGQFVHRADKLSIYKEMGYFRRFFDDYNPQAFRAEWRVFDEEHGIAGTIDFVARGTGDEFEIYDWKRSHKLPDHNRFQNGLGGLSHLEDSSYVHYCLQQNLYRFILERNYGMKVRKMSLVVLHPDNDDYMVLDVPRMEKEVKYMVENYAL